MTRQPNPRNYVLRDVEQAIRTAALAHGVEEAELALDLHIPTDQRDAIVDQIRQKLGIENTIAKRAQMDTFGDLYAFLRGYLGLVDPTQGESKPLAATSSLDTPPAAQASSAKVGGGSGETAPAASTTSPAAPGDHLRAVRGSEGHRLSTPLSTPSDDSQGSQGASEPVGRGTGEGATQTHAAEPLVPQTLPQQPLPPQQPASEPQEPSSQASDR